MARKIDRPQTFNAGAVVTPKTLATVPVLGDGQIASVTDRGPVSLVVRKGGSLVPALTVETSGQINLTVDYATGASPPAGTTVTTQAEFDALGAPLKYAQEALEILPTTRGALVKVELLAGIQYAKPDIYGFGYTSGLYYQGQAGKAKKLVSDDPSYYAGRTIVFWGEDAEAEADQAGTVSVNRLVTRSTGTWTVDQHRGKTCLFTTGANAGTRGVIAANSTTALTLAGYSYTGGACTFTIVEPAATLVDHSYGAADGAGLCIEGPGTGILQFNNLKFGNTTDRISWGIQSIRNAVIQFNGCMLFIQAPGAHASNLTYTDATFWQSSIDMDADYGFLFGASAFAFISGCLIYGVSRGYGLLGGVSGGIFDIRCSFVRAAPTMASTLPLLFVWDTAAIIEDVFLDGGLANTQGLSVGTPIGPGSVDVGGPVITNCSIALLATRGSTIAVSSVSGSSNGVGFQVDDGALISAPITISGLAATNPIVLDGTTFQYSDIPNLGDWIEGPSGSRIIR